MSNIPKYNPYKFKYLSLVERGRKEIELAELEMPGLMALCQEYSKSQSLKRALIAGCLYKKTQNIATLYLAKLGAEFTKLKQDQADHIGVTMKGQFKPEYY